jgi:hypothetical protein
MTSATENMTEINKGADLDTDKEVQTVVEKDIQLRDIKRNRNFSHCWEITYRLTNWLCFDKCRGGAFCKICKISQHAAKNRRYFHYRAFH